MIINNINLEKYEIKKPDYHFIDRPEAGLQDVSYEPARYRQISDNTWSNLKDVETGSRKAKIIFTGDITCFEKQIKEAETENGYDFFYSFAKLQPIFKQADLVVGNLETMLFTNAPYRSEKFVNESNYHCNAPVEFVDAVRRAGFDVVTNANNHDLDTGAVGLGETIDAIKRFGLIQTGTFKNNRKRFEIVKVNGIAIGIVALTCEHNKKDKNLTEEGRRFLLNDYSKETAQSLLKEARRAGADLVFICIHWGKENIQAPNEDEYRMAKELVNMGYDCIVGSHPHVLQKFAWLKKGEKAVPCFYSMGNFIAHNLNNPKGRSVLACFDIQMKDGKPSIRCSYIPIFVSQLHQGKKFTLLPISEKTENEDNRWKFTKIADDMGPEIRVSRDYEYEDGVEDEMPVDLVEKVQKYLVQTPVFTQNTEYPVYFDDGYFVYELYKDCAYVTALSSHAEIVSYTIPEEVLGRPVLDTREGAFQNNPQIKKMNFRKNMHTVPKRVLKGCVNLEGFQCGRSSRVIEEEAFADCPNLSIAVFNPFVYEIKDRAFANCTGLMSAKIHPNVRVISDTAFEGCDSLTIYCEKNTVAERYAIKHNIPYVYLKLSRDDSDKEESSKKKSSKKSPKKAVVPQVEGFAVTVKRKGISVSWDKLATDGVKYKLYRKADGENVYQRIRTTVKSSYLDEQVKKNKKYSYKMRAFVVKNDKEIHGKFGDAIDVVFKRKGIR